MYSLIIFAFSLIIIILAYTLIKKEIDISKYIKLLSVAFCVFGIIRYFLSDSFVEIVSGGQDILQSILRWTYHIAYAVIPISIFFGNKLFRNIAVCFTLPVSVVCTIFFDDTFEYFITNGAGGYYIPEVARAIFYSLELTLAIILPVLMALSSKHIIKVDSPKEALINIVLVPLMMIQMMPSYIPKSLLSDFTMDTGMFGEFHIMWLATLLIETIALHFIFRNKSDEDKKLLLIFLVIAQVMHTTSPMIRGFTLSRLPFQLCNIAAFFYFYMIVKRNKKVFDFCYLANLIGAAIAIALASFSSDTLSFWNIHYIYEHSFVVMVPVLAYSLGYFKRLDKNSLKYMFKYFTIYFVFVFIFGTLANGLDTSLDPFPVNHFYMFNPTVAVEYLPFVDFVDCVHWTFGEFQVFPVLVVTIYIVFNALNVLFYFITIGTYKLSDMLRAKLKKEPDTITV